MKIKTGDNVIVLRGKERGKTAKVIQVLRDTDQVILEGINVKQKYQKNTESKKENKIVGIEYPLHVSNVAIVDEKSGKPSKIKIEWDEKGKKKRILKRSGQEIK